MKFPRSILSSLFLIVSLCSIGQEQLDPVRVFNASCDEVCDGSAEFMTYRTIPGTYYYWMSEVDDRYHSMNDAILDQLCPGKYRIRQVDVIYQNLEIEAMSDSSLSGFEDLCSFSFSSMGKREISLYIKLDKEVNHLNYYLSAEYTTDGGLTWNSSQQFHQKLISQASGLKEVYYLVNFPRSAQEKDEIRLNIHRRITDELSEQTDFVIEQAFLESKEFEEYVFEVGVTENIRIRSTISNELEGGDGYVQLTVEGGLAPYVCSWEDGSIGEERKDLVSGLYNVVVTDSKNCTEEARYVILPPEGTEAEGLFHLKRIDESHVYQLIVKEIYRQPMDLVLSSNESIEVKRFQINPLYEDLRMELDLSFLQNGLYTATLSTSGFSKKIAIRID